MSNWVKRHKVIWVALGNDDYNTLIGVADDYKTINKLGMEWSKIAGQTHYLREYVEKPEPTEPVLPDVVEINGNYYRKELS